MMTIGGEGLSTAEIIIIVVAIIKWIDFMILLDCEDFSFLNPIRNYKMWKSLNWFGVAIFTLILNIFHPLFSIGYWFYKLCTVGRRKGRDYWEPAERGVNNGKVCSKNRRNSCKNNNC